MNTEFTKKLQDLQFHARAVVDNTAIMEAGIPNYERILRHNLARQLAESIVRGKIETMKGEFCTTFIMDVLVMDYDTFYSYVRKIAAKIHHSLRQDAARLEWYFSDKPKGLFVPLYMKGLHEHWSLDQWRLAIDSCLQADKGER